MDALGQATIARALWSRRQLLEVMVDFWSNHLNITCPSSEVWDSRHRYDADVIRRHALGTFAEMLQAATTHPAMLRYLNNAESTKDAPNENLGRELLELHTVGVDAGYGEDDVKACARLLTGLSVDWDTGEFVYRAPDHHVGPLAVLGWRSANASADGRAAVASLTGYLARHPATAQRICRKLAIRFVADDPDPALVKALAAVYLKNGTAIVPVLRSLFASAPFAAAGDRKLRRPFEALAATARTLDLQPPEAGTHQLQELFWALGGLGQQPMAWPQPDGYPDVATSWRTTAGTLARWNLNLSLAADWWPKGFTRAPISRLVPTPLPATHGALVSALGERLHSRPLPAAHRNAACAFLGVAPTAPLRADSEAAGWRLPYLVALLLDAPAHMLR
jgi:uncharacterized protein (DUF1800 family)